MPLVEHQQAFEDDLPFEEFTVRVAEADLPQLPVILKGLMDHPDRPVAAKQVRATWNLTSAREQRQAREPKGSAELERRWLKAN